ncbi:hypothetical protein HAL07_00800 [Helicobacter ailurogastricus]|uniref:Uncharacterized protein n=1 Tax=Helicobacter ailurogastricus TaxID=1578720 RepID=A0A0K2Y2A9_9HELI|nr:hypothetical protein HAL07_00800 [Helicobacter ailurogastricus]
MINLSLNGLRKSLFGANNQNKRLMPSRFCAFAHPLDGVVQHPDYFLI